jgi:hypothetical protein
MAIAALETGSNLLKMLIRAGIQLAGIGAQRAA